MYVLQNYDTYTRQLVFRGRPEANMPQMHASTRNGAALTHNYYAEGARYRFVAAAIRRFIRHGLDIMSRNGELTAWSITFGLNELDV